MRCFQVLSAFFRDVTREEGELAFDGGEGSFEVVGDCLEYLVLVLFFGGLRVGLLNASAFPDEEQCGVSALERDVAFLETIAKVVALIISEVLGFSALIGRCAKTYDNPNSRRPCQTTGLPRPVS